MNTNSLLWKRASWAFGSIILVLGILNLFLVHPVPGVVYILLSLVFFPPVDKYFRNKLGLGIPAILKIILFLIIIWFTMGISDLGEMMGL